MRLQIISRTGHFNLCNPSEESISTAIRAFDSKGNFIDGCSIESDQELDINDFELDIIANQVADMIEAYQKKLWISSSRDKDLKFVQWLRDHSFELSRGTIKNRISTLKVQAKKINEEIKGLKHSLALTDAGEAFSQNKNFH